MALRAMGGYRLCSGAQAVVQRATDRREMRRLRNEMAIELWSRKGSKRGGGEAAPPAPRCRFGCTGVRACGGLNERQDRGRQLRWKASGGARVEKGNESWSAAQRDASASKGGGQQAVQSRSGLRWMAAPGERVRQHTTAGKGIACGSRK